MKYLFLLLIIPLLFLISPIGCDTVSNLLPKALASDTQVIVEQVEADTDDVFAEIQRNIDLVADLKVKVEQSRLEGQPLSLDTAIKDLQTVTLSYEKLSDQHEAIRKGLLRKIANIENMRTRVGEEITSLKQKRADYTEQLRTVSDPVQSMEDVRKESLSQAIRYVDAQITLWTEFNEIEADIVAEMDSVQLRIDGFLCVIDSSAILFREGLNLLVLQRDINDALSLFTRDMPRIEQLTEDMQKSWDNLDYLIENLTSLSL